jgi:hypothetical protein
MEVIMAEEEDPNIKLLNLYKEMEMQDKGCLVNLNSRLNGSDKRTLNFGTKRNSGREILRM